MSFKIRWLSDDYVDADVGDIFTVVNSVFTDKGGDERNVSCFLEDVEYERIEDSVSSDSNDNPSAVTLVRYNGKLYDKRAFEEAIQGLVVYCVES